MIRWYLLITNYKCQRQTLIEICYLQLANKGCAHIKSRKKNTLDLNQALTHVQPTYDSHSLSLAPKDALQLNEFSAEDWDCMPSKPFETCAEALQLLLLSRKLWSNARMAEPLPIHYPLQQNLHSPQARTQSFPSSCTFKQALQSIVRDMLEASNSEAVRKLPYVQEALIIHIIANNLWGWPGWPDPFMLA